MTEDALEGVVASLTKQLGMLAPDGRLAALDSLKRVELVVALEELLKIDLFEAQFRPADFITVATVVALVTRAGGAANAALANAARASAVIESAAVDDRAEQALADHVRALSEAELAAELALWSSVDLVPERSAIANELDDARGTLFSRLLAQHRIDADDGRPLARRSATACEVTFTQERMWASHRLGDTVRLGYAHAFPIRGELDVDAMRSSFATLAARHAAMRSRMVVDGARLVQSVDDGARVLDVVDLSALPADERTARARALFDATAQAHDLAVEPFRCQLVRLDEREHLLLLAAHHIVCDGVSYRAMWPDWSTLYAAATANTPVELPALDFEFTDFCFWQNTLAQRPVGAQQLAFWRDVVAHSEDVEVAGDLSCPPRSELRLYAVGDIPVSIDGPVWEALRAHSTHWKLPTSSIVATAFLLFLTRQAGRSAITVSGGSHLRRRPGSDRLMGPFVTPYPMAIAFDESASVERAAHHYHQTVLVHHKQRGVAPTPALARWPELVRYNLNYQVTLEAPTRFGDAALERFRWNVRIPFTSHDVALYLFETPGGPRGTLVYNAERFSARRAQELVAHLGAIVAAIANAPDQPVAGLPRA